MDMQPSLPNCYDKVYVVVVLFLDNLGICSVAKLFAHLLIAERATVLHDISLGVSFRCSVANLCLYIIRLNTVGGAECTYTS